MSTGKEIPEVMGAFFDARATGYDDYIRDDIFGEVAFTQFYQAVSAPIEETAEPLDILDLGCGTGLEIDFLLSHVPNARITGVDLSEEMLDLLRKRYAARMDQITLIKGSYLGMPLGTQAWDHVISVMSMHHILQDTKLELYRKIRAALKPGGKYIEGDSVVFPETKEECLAEYDEFTAELPQAPDGYYHIDVPFTMQKQRSLLLEAGFRDYRLVWQKDSTADWNAAVYVVTA
jgi:tRNA (cmo5U34)-methyltransferase